MAREVLESRAPVGSSARRMSGFVTRARAIATRCFCPPDISEGRCSAHSRRPTFSRCSRARPSGDALVEERERDVLRRGLEREEVEALEDEADLAVAHLGGASLREIFHERVAEGVGARVVVVEDAEDVQERRLATAGGPRDRDELPPLDEEIDVAKHVERVVPELVRLVEPLDADHCGTPQEALLGSDTLLSVLHSRHGWLGMPSSTIA
jgi:hypothetical protein